MENKTNLDERNNESRKDYENFYNSDELDFLKLASSLAKEYQKNLNDSKRELDSDSQNISKGHR